MGKDKVELGTIIGSCALGLWSVEPLLVSELVGMPLFETLTLIFVSCFIFTAIRITITRRWGEIFSQSLFVWLFGTLTICGSDLCYILGAYCAPIAHVDLIDYLWPCMLVFFIGFLPNQQFSLKYVIGAILGFVGIFQLIGNHCSLIGINNSFVLGYLIAFIGVIIWGLYFIYSCHNIRIPIDMIGAYCGLGAIITATFHFSLEKTIIPSASQGSMAIILGFAGPGLAYQLWDYGMKFGNAKLLSVSCYPARVLGMILLVYFGKEPFSISLVVACALTILGVFISTMDERLFRKLYCYIASYSPLARLLRSHPLPHMWERVISIF